MPAGLDDFSIVDGDGCIRSLDQKTHYSMR
jgi:hypothetical protein